MYLNYQAFYYLFDHTIQSFCRYINYKCKESELLCFSCRWWFAPAVLLSKRRWELQAGCITTIRLPQRSCRWHSEEQRISLLSPSPGAAGRSQQRPGPGSVPAVSVCRTRGTARRAQRGAECAAAGGAGSRSCLQSKGMSGALGSTGLREGRLRKRDRYGRKEITALGRQAI